MQNISGLELNNTSLHSRVQQKDLGPKNHETHERKRCRLVRPGRNSDGRTDGCGGQIGLETREEEGAEDSSLPDCQAQEMQFQAD